MYESDYYGHSMPYATMVLGAVVAISGIAAGVAGATGMLHLGPLPEKHQQTAAPTATADTPSITDESPSNDELLIQAAVLQAIAHDLQQQLQEAKASLQREVARSHSLETKLTQACTELSSLHKQLDETTPSEHAEVNALRRQVRNLQQALYYAEARERRWRERAQR